MPSFFNSPLTIGSLTLPNRLIQGPLAGYSCAPFRQLFYQFMPPAYCVSEMISAFDLIHKHDIESRYLYRATEETRLCYQISGNDPILMGDAAAKLQALGADLIDINCGCPKPKIRKKGAGSALLEQPQQLQKIIQQVKKQSACPLTIKIRLQGNNNDLVLASLIEEAGADALIIHGRHWTEDYDKPCDWHQIAAIKQAIQIPVIANGDIANKDSLIKAMQTTGCDGFMISRAGTGKPWLYQMLLSDSIQEVDYPLLKNLFLKHLQGLAALESEYQALLQSKSLVRYYFGRQLSADMLRVFYALKSLQEMEQLLSSSHWVTSLQNTPSPIHI